MPLTLTPGSVGEFRRIVKDYGVTAEVDRIVEQLRALGATDVEIDKYLRRKFGFPSDFRERHERLVEAEMEPG
jgi:hypothetical protein